MLSSLSLFSSQSHPLLLLKPSHSLLEKQSIPTTITKNNNYSTPTKYPLLFSQTNSYTTTSVNSYKKNLNLDVLDLENEQFLDPSVFAFGLQECCTVREARKIHSVVLKCFGDSVMFVNNNLISVYVRLGELGEARKVFDEMSERNIVSWTAMLNGYLKSGSDDEVMGLFIELIENGIQPNSKTFVCVLNLCSRRMDLEFGMQIHACVVKGNWSNLILDSAIVYFYAQCGELSGSFRVFNKMPERDVVSWTSMITACAQHGYGEEAISMFSKMQSEGFVPNEFTVCSVLKACGMEKNLKFGRQLHCAVVKKMFNNDVFVGTSLVGMYVKCEEPKDGRKVFDGMKKRNTVTWTSMIAGYAQNGLGEEAIALFRVMKRRHIFANSSTIVSILGACGSVRASLLGKEVHAQILKSSINSNIYIGSSLVWFYCRCSEYSYAIKVLQSMPERDVVSWTAIILGYARLGHGSEALEFLNKMLWDYVEPNPFTYSSALKACGQQESVLQGKVIHSTINKTPSLSNVYVGSSLIDMYVKCGFLTDALQVFDTMPERNLVSWKSMILGYARNGLCREALQLMYRMKAEGNKVDDYIQTTVFSACGDIEWDSESLP
ncbi:hypothetical protein ACHQM5_022365 [Ranunculus cassubicifolius]